MTDKKISELVAVTTVEDTDEYVVARAGASNKITGANLKAATGGGGGGGSSPFLTASVTLTDAEIKTLPTDPVTVVASPGGSVILIPTVAVIYCDTTAGFYDNVNPTDAYLQISRPAGGQPLLSALTQQTGSSLSDLIQPGDVAAVVLGPAGQVAAAPGYVYARAAAVDALPGEPLALYVSNPLSGGFHPPADYWFTGGDPANSMQVVVSYCAITV